jgi:hypothetical protein
MERFLFIIGKWSSPHMKINHLDENLNRLIDINNKHLNHITRIQQVSMKHEHQLQLQQADISFQHKGPRRIRP